MASVHTNHLPLFTETLQLINEINTFILKFLLLPESRWSPAFTDYKGNVTRIHYINWQKRLDREINYCKINYTTETFISSSLTAPLLTTRRHESACLLLPALPDIMMTSLRL